MFEENWNHNKRMFLIRMSRNLSIILVCYVLCETMSLPQPQQALFCYDYRLQMYDISCVLCLNKIFNFPFTGNKHSVIQVSYR